jgi:hypothetical protein
VENPNSCLARGARYKVVQFEAVWGPIDFQCYARLTGCLDDALEIELHSFTAANRTRRRVADDVYSLFVFTPDSLISAKSEKLLS